MKYFNIIFLLLIINYLFFNKSIIIEKNNYVLDTKYVSKIDIKIDKLNKKEEKIIDAFNGSVTGYYPFCSGCIGITASGYEVFDTIHYEDSEYGTVRIVAADKSIPFGSIVKLTNIKNHGEILAIVLDRGSAIGFNKGAVIDLLFESEIDAINFGRKYNVLVNVIRYGY